MRVGHTDVQFFGEVRQAMRRAEALAADQRYDRRGRCCYLFYFRFRGIAEADRRALSADGDANDPIADIVRCPAN